MSRRAVRPFRARLERPEVTKTGEFSNVISGENCSATHIDPPDDLAVLDNGLRAPSSNGSEAPRGDRSAPCGHGSKWPILNTTDITLAGSLSDLDH